MKLHVYSLRRPVFFREASSVSVKTHGGEITILDNHEPIIASLDRGTVRIVEASGEVSLVETSGGFVEVRPRGDVTILVE
jgi:F-type H+-transporting ATPase subunit epsilon